MKPVAHQNALKDYPDVSTPFSYDHADALDYQFVYAIIQHNHALGFTLTQVTLFLFSDHF